MKDTGLISPKKDEHGKILQLNFLYRENCKILSWFLNVELSNGRWIWRDNEERLVFSWTLSEAEYSYLMDGGQLGAL